MSLVQTLLLMEEWEGVREAVDAATHSLEDKCRNSSLLQAAANASISMEDHESALRYLDSALEIDPADAQTLRLRDQIARSLGPGDEGR